MSISEDEKEHENGVERGGEALTLELSNDAVGFRRSLERTRKALANVHKSAAFHQVATLQETGASIVELQREMEAVFEPLSQITQQVESALEQYREAGEAVTRQVEGLTEVIRPVLEAHRETTHVLEVSAARMTQTFAASRVAFRPILESSLRATGASTTLGDVGDAAERILDEVAHPPESNSDADGLTLITERACKAISEYDLTRGEAIGLVALLVSVLAWCLSTLGHGRIEARVERTRQAVEKVEVGQDELLEEVAEIRNLLVEDADDGELGKTKARSSTGSSRGEGGGSNRNWYDACRRGMR